MALLGEHRGSIQDSMPQCTTHTFLRMDTYNAAFDDVTLVNKFCSIAFNGTIMRTLIVSHGSGSLTVAQALHTGACQLGTRTAWYMASPPLAGSEVRPLPDAASFPLVGSPCCNAVASRACRWPCLPTTCARRPTLTRSKCATRCVWGGGRCPHACCLRKQEHATVATVRREQSVYGIHSSGTVLHLVVLRRHCDCEVGVVRHDVWYSPERHRFRVDNCPQLLRFVL